MTVVMPKQSEDPSKPPRRGNPPWKDILLGVGALALAGLILALTAGARRVSVRGIFGGVVLAIAGPYLIIRGIVNLIRGG
ncbi:MAG TPA: hypothetical protein VFF06_34915 [Polyangia bacterium]|nr:hypothetical protein [Polyangia bacterium]